MNKLLIGVLCGAVLGAFDGLTALVSDPATKPLIVGIVIGTMTLTGLGTSFGNYVVSIGKESLLLSLILTMVVSLVLGMGIPTIPNYIITSSLAAPALLKLGVEPQQLSLDPRPLGIEPVERLTDRQQVHDS